MSDWLDRLERDAPNLVGSFRALDDGRFIALRREVRRLAGAGSAVRLAREHAAVVAHLDGLIAAASPEVLAAPGGEEDWNVAQALGHATAARQGLVLAAQMAALGRWPAEAPTVVPGGPAPLPPRPPPGPIFRGLWQCVTGGLHDGERVPLAALREVAEETGLGPDDIEAR